MNIFFDHYFLVLFTCFVINLVSTIVTYASVRVIDRYVILSMFVVAAVPAFNAIIATMCFLKAAHLTLLAMIEAFKD